MLTAIGYVVKKAVSAFVYPLGLSLLGMIAGLALLKRSGKFHRSGFALATSALLILTASSLPITAHLLLLPLEQQAGEIAHPAALRRQGIRYVAVLGAELVRDDQGPPAERLGGSLLRVMEGIRLWKGLPRGKLILSGGSSPGMTSSAEGVAALPLAMGVPRTALVIQTSSWDTEDEARAFKEVIGDEPFALVTGAFHMPRSLALFQGLGMRPVACPCNYLAHPRPWFRWLLPEARALQYSTLAIHERLGMLWYWLRGITS